MFLRQERPRNDVFCRHADFLITYYDDSIIARSHEN